MRRILLVFVWLFICSNSFSQEYFFKNYGVKEGLLQSNVLCALQDSKGYLWLGTEGGLSRFDGIEFQNFTKEDGLAESNATAIFQDRAGTIWLGHQNGGISCIKDGNFHIFADSTFTKTVSGIVQAADAKIWMSSMGEGVIVFHPDSNRNTLTTYHQYQGKEGLGDYVFSMQEDKSSTMWFVTDIGLKTKNEAKATFDFQRIEGMPSFQITSILHDKDRNLWIGTYQGGLYRYNPSSKKLVGFRTSDGLASNWISTLFQDSKKNVWVGTWGGGISKIAGGSNFVNYTQQNGLEDEKIRTILEDREGNIVIGSNEHGFALYSGDRFKVYNNLTNNQVWSVIHLNGRIYIGHNSGIDVLEKGNKTAIASFSIPVRSMSADKSGNIWVGTWGHGVYKLNTVTQKIQPQDKINDGIDPNVNSISIGNDGHIWISTIKGVSKANPTTLEIQSFPGIIGKVQIDVATVHHTKDMILLGTRKNGLIAHQNDTFKRILETEISSAPTSITSYNETIFVGTEGSGVYVIRNGEMEEKITRKEGLLSNFVLAISFDNEKGNLWMVTNKGICSYNLSTKEMRNFDENDGFTPIEGKLNSICRSGNTLYIGSVSGLVEYNSEADQRNTITPLINLTRMKLNLKDTLLADGVQLPYNNNSLRFDFSSICLTNPDKIKHQVRLEGWDEWHFVDNSVINYSNLPEGEYTLMIKSANNDGVWNKEPFTFSFTIHPPFWRTWWFYLICIIVVIIGFFAFVKWREKKLQQEKKILADKVEERTAEVVEKSKQLGEAYEHITSSIVYAERIQRAILPSDKAIQDYFPESYVFFQPRDIVSGDFYWLEKSGDEILFSAIDCTGHGVPGAFVSMVGHNLLNQSVRKHGLTKPSDILDDLDREVKRTLQTNDESSVKDGMDLALCSFNKKKMLLQYAGAHNNMYHIRKGELTEYKANRFAIGYKGRDEGKSFDNVEISVEEGDVIYIFSDGFVDQFGGELGRKYMSKRFKQYLIDNYNNNFTQQKNDLSKEIKNWMSNKYKQIDDILVWGIRF